MTISPLNWKSKIIEKVTPDIKTAETLSLENALDDAIHLSQMLSEIYTGDGLSLSIPLIINEDSKALVDSLYSTKKVKRKTMRVIISVIQQYLRNGTIHDIRHVNSSQQIADVFTKNGVKSNNILHAISNGNLDCLTLENTEEGWNQPPYSKIQKHDEKGQRED